MYSVNCHRNSASVNCHRNSPSESLANGSLRGSQFIVSVNGTAMRGRGMFAAGGYSAVVGASPGRLKTGTYINRTYQGGAALGAGIEITAARPLTNPDFSASFGPRYGGGIYGAKGTQLLGIIAFPQMGCRE